MHRGLAVLFALLFTVSLRAQQPGFKSGVELVRIPVSVMRSGEVVNDGLSASDFILKEDGVTQSIAVFERETLPISLCIVVDVSGSMSDGPIELAMLALREVSGALQAQDEMAIITFAQSPRVVLPWSPPSAVRLALGAEMGGATSLNDATRAALDLLESARNSRPVVLLITDGFDNASRVPLSEVVKTRRQSETLVYAFEVARDRTATRLQFGSSVLEPAGINHQELAQPGTPTPTTASAVPSLVGDSGGMAYPLSNGGELRLSARRVIDELRHQYTLGYTPEKPFNGKYRRVKVEVTTRGYQIRHRGGYLALPSPERR